jgi:hypothetical protein
MKIFGLQVRFGGDKDELFLINDALKVWGDIDRLAQELEKIQRSGAAMKNGVMSIGLPASKAANQNMIRLTIDPRQTDRQKAALWLTGQGIPIAS